MELIGDTGAGISLIRKALFDRLDTQKPLSTTNVKLVGASGETLKTHGKTVLIVSIADRTIDFPFYVVDGLKTDVILGNDIMKEMGLTIDLGLEIVKTPLGNWVPIDIYKPEKDKILPVKVVQETVIPANTACLVKTEIPCLDNNNKTSCEVYTTLKLFLASKVYIPGGIIDRKNPIIEVVNINPYSVQIFKGQTIGFTTIREDQPINIVDLRKVQDRDTSRLSPKEQQELDQKQLRELIDGLELETDSALLPEEIEVLRTFLKKNSHVFASNPAKPGITSCVKHTIDTGNEKPIRKRARRLTHSEQEMEKKHITQMMENGIIRKSRSPWASPIVMVTKPDGSIQFCVDYRALNKITKPDRYPLPRIDETIDKLRNMKYLSTLDLASGFWQIPMDEKDREKTAFISTIGLYEFNVMPFGLCNSPATFQRMMDEVCEGLEWRVGSDYIDDIIIGSLTFEEHLHDLQQLFDRLEKFGLTMKLQKCKFCRKKLLFLGHMVSSEGILPNPQKIEAIQTLQPPNNITGLRRFLGMTGYYRRFIEGYAQIASPLTKLLKKNNLYAWNEECQKAFEQLKAKLISPPILRYPDFNSKFILKTDASLIALGAALCQEEDGKRCVIAYWSKTLSDAEKKYTITQLECLALVNAINHFKHYIGGKEFTAITDHKALKWLLTSDHGSDAMLDRWKIKLMHLKMNIEYRPGPQNFEADLLSRIGTDKIVQLIVNDIKEEETVLWTTIKKKYPNLGTEKWKMREEIAKMQASDPDFQDLIKYLTLNQLPEDLKKRELIEKTSSKYEIRNKLLYRVDLTPRMVKRGILKARIVVPEKFREDILKLCHNSLIGGHLGTKKTYYRIQQDYFWPKMARDVRRWVETCMECTMKKGTPNENIGLSGHLKAEKPMDIVACDIIGPLTITDRGNRYILIFTDCFSRYVEAFPIQKQDAETIADYFVKRICCRHGIPRQFISDRGKQLIGQTMSAIHEKLGINQLTTSSYRPQGNAIVERANKTIVGILAMFVSEHQKDWDYLLPFAVYAYNTSVHEGIKETPYFVLYARDPNTPLLEGFDYEDFPERTPSLEEYCQKKRDLRKEIEERVRYYDELITQTRMRSLEEKQKQPRLQVGDLVWLYTKPTSVQRGGRKLTLPWKGPYKIALIISNTQIILKDLKHHKLKQPVHVSRLKLYTSPRKPWKEAKTSLKDVMDKEWEVERILDDDINEKGTRSYKVRWKGFTPIDDTWVSERDMCCPDLIRDYNRQKGIVSVINSQAVNNWDQTLMILESDDIVLKMVSSAWIE